MCKDCVKEVFPDRGNTVLDDGAYILNLADCANCGKRAAPKSINRKVVEEEEADKQPTVMVFQTDTAEESDNEHTNEVIHTTTYTHQCANCDHIIGDHYHRFQTSDALEQAYYMECILCGKGTDEKQVLSNDGDAALRATEEVTIEEAPQETEEQKQARKDLYAALVNSVKHVEVEEVDDETAWSD